MNLAPILFIDDKKIENKYEYRFQELKNQLVDCEDTIEFMSDLDIKSSVDQYIETVTVEPNPYLQPRKIIFIHVSQDDPKYDESLYNALKKSQPHTLFARFSGQGSLNLNRENLRFKRDDHIYNMTVKGLQKAIRFYKISNRFEPYILVYGKDSFLKKIEETDREINYLKRNVTNYDTLQRYGYKLSFEKIMTLAGLDSSRIEKGREYVKGLDNILDYFDMLGKYVKQIQNQANQDHSLLESLES